MKTAIILILAVFLLTCDDIKPITGFTIEHNKGLHFDAIGNKYVVSRNDTIKGTFNDVIEADKLYNSLNN